MIKEQLARLPIMEGLSADDLDLVALHVDTMRFAEGDDILREGEENATLFAIVWGRVRVWRRGQPTDVILAEVTAGGLIGELRVLEPGPATATVTAVEPGEAVTLEASALRRIEAEHPALAAALYRSLAGVLGRRLVEVTTRVLAHEGMVETLAEFDELRESLGKLV